MRIRFTKMQGAGNDFVVLDETRGPLGLSAAQYRYLADRHFGVGADQILAVRASDDAGADFRYVIHNADGNEVEHCGNGARCFMRYVLDKGLYTQSRVRVRTVNNLIELQMQPDGRVTVDMGVPRFELTDVPFEPTAAREFKVPGWTQWDLDVGSKSLRVAVLSMGNPHAVAVVDSVESVPLNRLGPLVEAHPAFPSRVNAGFMEVIDRQHVRLRVFERGAGETLSCGTGACAAAVAGMRLSLLDSDVEVQTRGGPLRIQWGGMKPDTDLSPAAVSVLMTGPANTVFEGEIDIPDLH